MRDALDARERTWLRKGGEGAQVDRATRSSRMRLGRDRATDVIAVVLVVRGDETDKPKRLRSAIFMVVAGAALPLALPRSLEADAR